MTTTTTGGSAWTLNSSRKDNCLIVDSCNLNAGGDRVLRPLEIPVHRPRRAKFVGDEGLVELFEVPPLHSQPLDLVPGEEHAEGGAVGGESVLWTVVLKMDVLKLPALLRSLEVDDQPSVELRVGDRAAAGLFDVRLGVPAA